MRAAAADLARRDPALSAVIAEVGPPRLGTPVQGPNRHFRYLVRAITFQQLAGQAARTIHGRVLEAVGDLPTPHDVLAADPAALRSAGLSAAKAASITDLATRCADGRLDLERIARRPDAAIMESVTEVRGIGPWTAEMFLLFQLRRPDVWPVGDLGVRKGWAAIQGRDGDVSVDELSEAGERYRPWRSVAAWYCWRALDVIVP